MSTRVRHILLVDDSVDDRDDARRMLLAGSAQHYRFSEVELGSEALRVCLESPGGPPDCVLLDFFLPDMDAMEVLSALRQAGQAPNCPVVVLTGSDDHHGPQVIRAGAQDFVGKDWSTPGSLTRAVENAMERFALHTERTRAEEKLRLSEERLRLAAHTSGFGIHDYDVATDRSSWSPEMYALTGLPPDVPIDLRVISALTHPEERRRIDAAMRAALDPRGSGEFCEEFRIRRADTGETRWFYNRSQTLFTRPAEAGAERVAVRNTGIVIDVTERRRSDEALRESEEKLRAIFNGTRDYIGLLDGKGTLVEVNAASLTFAGSRREDVLGVPYWDSVWFRFTPGGPELARDAVQRAVAGEAVRLEASLFTPAGEERIYELSFDPIRNSAGEVVLIVPEGREITKRKRREVNFAFLAELQKAFGALSSVEEIVDLASERVASHLGLAHCVLAEIDEAAEQAKVIHDHHRIGTESLTGTYRIADFNTEEEHRLLAAGNPVVIADVRQQTRPEEKAARFQALGIGAAALTSYVVQGKWRFVLGALRDEPCTWHPEDVDLLSDLATRIYLRIERSRAEQRLRESEARERARRAELETLMDAIPVSVLIAHDAACEDMTGNRAAMELLRLPLGSNAGRNALPGHRPDFEISSGGRLLAPTELPLQRAAATGEPVIGAELDLTFSDGTHRNLYGSALPLFDDRGSVRGCVGAFVDTTERKIAEDALRDAARRKDDFLAMLGHELRNPLAAIRHAVQIAHESPDLVDDCKWSGEVIDRQSQQLARMVDDLLDVARIKRGKVELRLEPVDLRVVIDRAASATRSLFKSKRHAFRAQVGETSLRVNGDPTRLEQVFVNLLNNAAKYTPEGGRIELLAEREETGFAVTVSDSGVGIPADLLPHVFDLFRQADTTLDRAQGGLGIGLTVVKSLVEMHGGRVTAESGGEKAGSRFTVRLPFFVEATPSATAVLAGRPGAFPRAVRVQVVDDHVDGAETLGRLLKRRNCEVRLAHDGPAALAAARDFVPEVCLLDLGLPGMDGYELARTLRALPGFQSALLIAISGYADAADRERSLAAGFDAHCAKPVDFPWVVDAIWARCFAPDAPGNRSS